MRRDLILAFVFLFTLCLHPLNAAAIPEDQFDPSQLDTEQRQVFDKIQKDANQKKAKSEKVVEVVRNFTRVKILESNNVGLRPGSIYDNVTIFESLFKLPQPGFNYEFIDSGLGAAEPLYPMYQKGHQGSWFQLIPAFFSEKSRHIDHYTSMVTPEGCLVEGLYGLRHISEYPKDLFAKERAEGYEQIVVRLEHYTRTFPEAQCGRHFSEDPDPNFKPMEFVKKYHKAMTFADFPQKELNRFEWKISAIRHIAEERNKKKWPRFDLEKLKQNSLWYYPQGHDFDYGISGERPQGTGLRNLNKPRQLLISYTPELRQGFPLSALLNDNEHGLLLNFLSGQPYPGFNPLKEPGLDTLNLKEVTPINVYTSGLYLEAIRDVYKDVSDRNHFALVAVTVKPYESQFDPSWQGTRVIPQIRFVYQMMDPRNPDRPFEQLYYHLKFDAIDRYADEATRAQQHQHFLKRFDQILALQDAHSADYAKELNLFLKEYSNRPMESLAFSSSLTGLWVFGVMSRSHDAHHHLHPLRVVREGVDVGYYSSTYDNDLFRAAIKVAKGSKKEGIQKILDDITVSYYRDPKRNDAQALNFGRITCAQCHQTAGRDGVHVALNDNLDRRITFPVRASEYFFREADLQLKNQGKLPSGDHH